MAAAVLGSVVGQAAAQEWSDPRIVTLDPAREGLTRINTSPETTQTLLFAQHERVQSVVLSDPGAYLVGLSGKADSLTLKANGPSAIAIMTVRTDARSYQLELVPQIAGPVAQVLRVGSGRKGTGARGNGVQREEGPVQSPTTWRLSGDRAIRPASINDDGARTYITWDEAQPLPAVFVVAESRDEETVDGRMRAGVFTIDRVYPRLVFRMDDRVAKAERVTLKNAKRARERR